MGSRQSAKKEKPKNTKGTLLRLYQYMTAYRGVFLSVLVLCLVSNVCALLGPSIAGRAINEAAAGVGNVNFSRVSRYAVQMLAFYIASSAITFVINYVMMHTSRKIGEQLRSDIFKKILKLPVGYFDRNLAGDTISRVSYDIDVITASVGTDVVQVMTSIVTVIGSAVMMMFLSPALSITMVLTITFAVLYTRYMSKRTRPLYSSRSVEYGRMNGYVEEMFSGQKTILAYAREQDVLNRFDEINESAAKTYYKAEHYGVTIGPTVGFINSLGLALIAMFGSLLYLNGMIRIGDISAFVLYSRKFSGPINEIANILNEIYSALAAAERVFHMLDEAEEAEDACDAVELENVKGNIAFTDVSFGYTPDQEIVHHFNLNASAGKLIAIVGPTGAGKTTIINLLMRFYDADRGQISVDSHEIKGITRKNLRRSYAMVLQDTWLFHGTIFENIAYGKEKATMEEVVAAAKAARIHNYIMKLPEGYSTIISGDGENISKGQKQLLTIARAMLYDSRMLILDEATSNVDTTTERQIQKALRLLMKDKTCFVIAHRLSTVQNADQILVIDHGNIVEQGSHQELMERKSFYYKLYASQFE